MPDAIKNVLTIDVEDYFHVSAFSSAIDRSAWDTMECRVERNTYRLLELLNDRNTSATFFVLGWVAERYPQLIRDINSQGHEVACHGYSHELVYKQSPRIFHDETRRAKVILEDIIQKRIAGYRAASYSIIEKSMWAIDVLIELGFDYDSSIFPVRHDRYGMPGSPTEPYAIKSNGNNRLIEFPLTTKEIFKYRLPVGGGGYFRIYPYMLTKWLLNNINSHESKPFVFYIHPWEIDQDQPRIKSRLLSRFRHYVNIERCENRFERLLNDFKFTTMETALNGMNLLNTVNENSSYKEEIGKD